MQVDGAAVSEKFTEPLLIMAFLKNCFDWVYSPTVIDTHAHMDDSAFDKDRETVLEKAKNEGMEAVIAVSESLESSRKNIQLGQQFELLKPAVGCHPHNAETFQGNEELEEMARDNRVVAIGETGLDYLNLSSKSSQKKLFELHIELSQRTQKPLSVHCREAHNDCYEMLKNSGTSGIMHCYSGPADMVKKFVEIGFYISFAGPVTFPNAANTRVTLRAVPQDRLLVETDSPVLSPHPHRGARNEPMRLGIIIDKVAELLGVNTAKAIEITTQNAMRVFKL